jgi:cytochrome c peroxidase
LNLVVVGVVCCASFSLAALKAADSRTLSPTPAMGWWRAKANVSMRGQRLERRAGPGGQAQSASADATVLSDLLAGRRLFERETFGGNGRTCLTCHSRETGTVSPADARRRFRTDPNDPLFVHDGSDDDDGDGFGDGVHSTRMRRNATVLMRIPLHPDVSVKGHPEIREVTVPRGIPTTLNTPALDPVLMLDGRQPTLQAQALGAITDHAQGIRPVSSRELDLLARFQQTPTFFSSPALAFFFYTGQHAPQLPQGRTLSERRGRVFFEDLPPDFSVNPPNFKPGACAACHSGPMLNETNQFLPVPVPVGTRFQTVLVSEFNDARNPVTTFVFRNQLYDSNPATNQDGTPDGIIEVTSPDPGRALITGRADDFFPFPPGSFDHLNAFKISPLWGVRDTAPYFHDNSAQTLEDVAEHYRRFFLVVSDPDGPGPAGPVIVLTEQDKQDIVAYLKLLK